MKSFYMMFQITLKNRRDYPTSAFPIHIAARCSIMLDYRMDTFLSLCETKSYTKTAAILHLTQPSVTQHIKYLEHFYSARCFTTTANRWK